MAVYRCALVDTTIGMTIDGPRIGRKIIEEHYYEGPKPNEFAAALLLFSDHDRKYTKTLVALVLPDSMDHLRDTMLRDKLVIKQEDIGKFFTARMGGESIPRIPTDDPPKGGLT